MAIAELKSKSANAILAFAENVGIQSLIGGGTYYILKSGQINTLGDLKALATAAALAGVVWAVGALKSRSGSAPVATPPAAPSNTPES